MTPTISVVDTATWTTAPWKDEFDDAVADYLKHSREEITWSEEWSVLGAAMLLRPDLRLWVVLDDSGQHVLSFVLARMLLGTQATGSPLCQVWQVYVNPKRARFSELFALGWYAIQEWAKSMGAARYTFMTRRISVAYDRLLRKHGFKPYAIMYTT